MSCQILTSDLSVRKRWDPFFYDFYIVRRSTYLSILIICYFYMDWQSSTDRDHFVPSHASSQQSLTTTVIAGSMPGSRSWKIVDRKDGNCRNFVYRSWHGDGTGSRRCWWSGHGVLMGRDSCTQLCENCQFFCVAPYFWWLRYATSKVHLRVCTVHFPTATTSF